jgi:serine/threonine protein kinase
VPCIDDDTLLEIAEGVRAIDADVSLHLSTCDDCRRVLGAAARGRGEDTHRDEVAPVDEPAWDELGNGVVVGGAYVLDRFLGSGGMSVVWSAHAIDRSGEVAIKIDRAIDSVSKKRSDRSAQIAMSLVHPNIVRTFEVIAATETRGVCTVLELLIGETLESRLEKRADLSLQEAARILVPVARAVSFAHARGVVHRDLKPQNIFMTREDIERVVVLDFGLAKMLTSWGPHSKLTNTGAVLGSPRTMAPEQIFGDAEIDARADVWALGVLAYRLLAGRPPIDGATIGAIMKEMRRGQIADLASLTNGLPEDVLTIVRASLIVAREDRLASAAPYERAFTKYV